MDTNGILIYGELNSDNSVKPVVRQLLTKSCELKNKIDNEKIRVCLIGSGADYESIVKELGSFGADEVIIADLSCTYKYNKTCHPEIFYQIVKKYNPRIILASADVQGKAAASFIAAKMNTGLTADCTNLDIVENKLLLSTRPTFGGQLTADILCRTIPQMATIQENVFKEQKINHSASVIIEEINANIIEKKIEIIGTQNKQTLIKDVTSSDIVVAFGRGGCNDKGFELITKLAKLLNAAIGGSREAFELGFITKSQQIGQTGKTISPKLYIAVGISGANQHLAGIKNSGKIIAINKDKDAPIFKYADYGIIGDLNEILNEITENFEKIKE